MYEGGRSGQSGDEEPRNRKGIPQRGIDLTLTYRVYIDHLAASVVVANRTKAPLTFELAWILEADFATSKKRSPENANNRRQWTSSPSAMTSGFSIGTRNCRTSRPSP